MPDSTGTPTDSALTLLMVAAHEPQAHHIVSILRAAGIPAFADDLNLVDEWGMALRTAMGIKIKVPATALDAARAALDAALEVGEEIGRLDPAELEMEPEDLDAGDVREEELAELSIKPTYNPAALILATLATAALVGVLIWLFARSAF